MLIPLVYYTDRLRSIIAKSQPLCNYDVKTTHNFVYLLGKQSLHVFAAHTSRSIVWHLVIELGRSLNAKQHQGATSKHCCLYQPISIAAIGRFWHTNEKL